MSDEARNRLIKAAEELAEALKLMAGETSSVPPVAGSLAGDHFDAELVRQARELDEEPQGA